MHSLDIKISSNLKMVAVITLSYLSTVKGKNLLVQITPFNLFHWLILLQLDLCDWLYP